MTQVAVSCGMHLLSRIALSLLGLSFGSSLACQMDNPAFDLGDAGETRGTGDGDGDLGSSGESKTTSGDGDGDTLADGDGDPTTGDGDPTTGDGDPTTGDGDGDPTTGDGDPTTGDGDGDGDGPLCGDGSTDPGEECDDGNLTDNDGCSSFCTSEAMGDGDGDMQMCEQLIEPMTCGDCLTGFCCSPEGLACANSVSCKCMLPCLANNFSELVCALQCDADPNTTANAVDTVECADTHCPEECTNG
jgi:cysteine-rich repeat protein